MAKYLTFDNLSSYKISFSLSNYVWQIVVKWKYFERNSVGLQFVRSIDSVSANIAEGYGRFGKKDKILFYRIARGSVNESLDWLEKSKVRNLVSEGEYKSILGKLCLLPKEINQLISFTNAKLKQ